MSSQQNNKFKIKPSLKDAFKGSTIKEIISDVVVDVLDGEYLSVLCNGS